MDIEEYIIISAIVLSVAVLGLWASESGPDSPVLTFSEDGLYDRGLSVDLPESGASVDCTVSRRNEFQVSESVFLYNGTECSTSFSVGDGNLSVNSSGVDVLFNINPPGEGFRLGYDFGESSALVCNVSDAEFSQGEVSRFLADCGVVQEDLSETWNNESFTDFNVIERGQDTIESESGG